MAEFVVAHILDDHQIGDRFTIWPLHVTILPPFDAPSIESVTGVVEAVALAAEPINLHVGDRAKFSSKTLVQKLIPSPELMSLHTKVLQAGEAEGWQITGRYIGKHYTPHITERAGRSYIDATFILDSLSVVENIGQGYRVIRSEVVLGSRS